MEPHAIDRPSRPQTSASARPQTSHNVHPRPSKEALESCFSAQSKLSSWSASPTLTPSLTPGQVRLDVPESPAHAQLQIQQLAERERFLEYQRTCLRNLRLGMEQSRKGRQEANAATVEERKLKVLLFECRISFANLVARNRHGNLGISSTRSRTQIDTRAGNRPQDLSHSTTTYGSILPLALARLLSAADSSISIRPQ